MNSEGIISVPLGTEPGQLVLFPTLISVQEGKKICSLYIYFDITFFIAVGKPILYAAEITLAQISHSDGSSTILYFPCKCYIQEIFRAIGDHVKEGTPLLKVTELEDLTLQIYSTFPDLETTLPVYRKYCQIGRSLENDPIVTEFKRFAERRFRESLVKSRFPSFFMVIASSGLGKTQLPFCILNQDILYIPLFNNQSIYKFFSPFTNILLEAIKRDFGILFPSDKTPQRGKLSCRALEESLKKEKLYTYGFLFSLFELMKDKLCVLSPLDITTPVKIRRKTMTDLSKLENLPLVFIDEFYTSEGLPEIYLIFLRNSIRLLRVRLVVMGTNMSAANMFTTAASCSRKEEDDIWVHLWHLLPNYSMERQSFLCSLHEKLAIRTPSLKDTLNMLIVSVGVQE